MSNSVATSIKENARKEAAGRIRATEKADRATVEQVGQPFRLRALLS